MGISVEVDHARRRVYARASGPVTFGDIQTHLAEEGSEGGLPYRELVDGRDGEPQISAAEVRDVVELLRTLGKSSQLGPTAVVVDTDVAYGMLRMLEILLGDVCEIRPFRDPAEAESWLSAPKGDRGGG
jgi:hypothetical protein